MTDEHLTNTIIANAILEGLKADRTHDLDPEVAKIIAKRILAALEEAGLQITVVDEA
jgi:hypothetical protein